MWNYQRMFGNIFFEVGLHEAKEVATELGYDSDDLTGRKALVLIAI
jgi:hypothetical protein